MNLKDKTAAEAAMEKRCREIGELVGAACEDLAEPGGAKTGFVLLLFEFGPSGFATYISNAQRAGMIRALDELVARLRCDEKPEAEK